jgi:DNA polymerase III epsilon subunit family exonuclease
MFDLADDVLSIEAVTGAHALSRGRRVRPRGRREVSVDAMDLVAIDTETTGLGWYERLVELGAVRFRGGEVVARWRTLVDPRRLIPARVSAIHGITDDLVAGAPDARAALLELQRFCEGAVLLAHNAVFDRDILAAEHARAGLAAPYGPLYCTWRFSKHCLPDAPRHGLAPLAKHLALPTESPHRALADAELTQRLFAACCAALPSPVTLATLDAHATEVGAPWRVAGSVRRVRDLTALLRPLRSAKAAGQRVALLLRGEDGVEGSAEGVPLVLYERGGEGMVDLYGADGRVTTVPAASVVGVRVGG